MRCYWAYAAGLEAVRLDSAYGKGHVRAGRGYLDQGDLFNARLQFRKALDLDSVDKAAAKVRRRVSTSVAPHGWGNPAGRVGHARQPCTPSPGGSWA